MYLASVVGRNQRRSDHARRRSPRPPVKGLFGGQRQRRAEARLAQEDVEAFAHVRRADGLGRDDAPAHLEAAPPNKLVQ